MTIDGTSIAGLAAAFGGGLLVGTEREWRLHQADQDQPIGVRTCTLTAVIGAVSALLGVAILVAGTVAVAAFALASYRVSRGKDPGLTTEFSLLATYLLGALAMTHMRLAAALFVTITILLAGKDPLHRFAREALSRSELNSFLLLAASALIVLPLLPDRVVDPFHVLNPRKLWLLVVWVMTINTAGYVGLRTLGMQRGLPLAGFFGGFVSSSATIAGMAQRSRSEAGLRKAGVAGALLSNIATVIQLALILAVVDPVFFAKTAAIPLGVTALCAVVVGAAAVLQIRGQRQVDEQVVPLSNRPFVFSHALIFASIVAASLLVSAALGRWKGAEGTYLAAVITGFADVHAATVAIGQLSVTHTIASSAALRSIVVAFTANSILKLIGAATGGWAYFRNVAIGIIVLNSVFALSLFIG